MLEYNGTQLFGAGVTENFKGVAKLRLLRPSLH